jgi:hypothetical protein
LVVKIVYLTILFNAIWFILIVGPSIFVNELNLPPMNKLSSTCSIAYTPYMTVF